MAQGLSHRARTSEGTRAQLSPSQECDGRNQAQVKNTKTMVVCSFSTPSGTIRAR